MNGEVLFLLVQGIQRSPRGGISLNQSVVFLLHLFRLIAGLRVLFAKVNDNFLALLDFLLVCCQLFLGDFGSLRKDAVVFLLKFVPLVLSFFYFFLNLRNFLVSLTFLLLEFLLIFSDLL